MLSSRAVAYMLNFLSNLNFVAGTNLLRRT